MPVKVRGIEMPFARKGLLFVRMKMTVARMKITPVRTERALKEQVLPFARTEHALIEHRATPLLAPRVTPTTWKVPLRASSMP